MDNSHLEALAQEERARQEQFHQRVFCCTSTACLSAGAGDTVNALDQAVKDRHCDKQEIEVVRTGCMGLCSHGPLVRVECKDESPTLYGGVTAKIASDIIQNHILTAEVSLTQDNSYAESTTLQEELEYHQIPLDLPFFKKQARIVLDGMGHINPEKLEDYLAYGGFQALAKVLLEMTPEQVCDEILRSGLRGRGGAGFPTGMKWNLMRKETAPRKFVIVNGDEGDPGAYMDRAIMEDDPYRVLEGMIICAYAVGASYGYLYIRGEYPNAIQRISRAIRMAKRRGLLGKSILGSDFQFDCDVRIGAGAFVCGEETALIHSIEGKRGVPRIRPPYPSTSGLWGAPTVINNVETMGNIPTIIKRGADWFATIGTEKSKGTKVFALAGQLNNTGLIEVPMGITLREIVYDIGGGIPSGWDFKAVQTGGPSGGCVPEEYLDMPVDYESLRTLGSIMGSGGMVVIDGSTRMPDFARFFIDFCVDESCGKCLPCRVGTVQIRSLLDKIIDGQGTVEDLNQLEKLCLLVKRTSLCGLGQSAPNPVLSTLNYFRYEYEALLYQTDIPLSD
jgi:bidirectional [NiFe] hydrogenase diaphorase subunit